MVKPYKLICDDVLSAMATLKDESIDCVITSPPYWQLRDRFNILSVWQIKEVLKKVSVLVRKQNLRKANTHIGNLNHIGRRGFGCVNTLKVKKLFLNSQKNWVSATALYLIGLKNTIFQPEPLAKHDQLSIGDCQEKITQCMEKQRIKTTTGKADARLRDRLFTLLKNGQRLVSLFGNATTQNVSNAELNQTKRNYTFITSFLLPSRSFGQLKLI